MQFTTKVRNPKESIHVSGDVFIDGMSHGSST